MIQSSSKRYKTHSSYIGKWQPDKKRFREITESMIDLQTIKDFKPQIDGTLDVKLSQLVTNLSNLNITPTLNGNFEIVFNDSFQKPKLKDVKKIYIGVYQKDSQIVVRKDFKLNNNVTTEILVNDKPFKITKVYGGHVFNETNGELIMGCIKIDPLYDRKKFFNSLLSRPVSIIHRDMIYIKDDYVYRYDIL